MLVDYARRLRSCILIVVGAMLSAPRLGKCYTSEYIQDFQMILFYTLFSDQTFRFRSLFPATGTQYSEVHLAMYGFATERGEFRY
jgi:hypothetical protein